MMMMPPHQRHCHAWLLKVVLLFFILKETLCLQSGYLPHRGRLLFRTAQFRENTQTIANHNMQKLGEGQRRFSSKLASLHLSLDTMVTPKPSFPIVKGVGLAVTLSMLANAFVPRFLENLSTDTIDIRKGSASSFLSSASSTLKTWRRFKVEKIIPVDSSHSMILFSKSDNQISELALDIGQEVQVCFLNRQDETVMECVVPCYMNTKNGMFCCITSKDSPENGKAFQSYLNQLVRDEEIAVREGKSHLGESGLYCDPIRQLTVVASSFGVSPALELIQYAAENNIQLEHIEFVWINRDKTGFICDEFVKELSDHVNLPLHVSRFTNPTLYNVESYDMSVVQSIIKPYSYGNVVLLCGPLAFHKAFSTIVEELGYNPQNILHVNTP